MLKFLLKYKRLLINWNTDKLSTNFKYKDYKF